MKQNTFTKIAVFRYTAEAIILKGKIESEGITVFMFDNNTVDTDPLVSNAIGGVKLFVHTENAEKAKIMVAEFNSINQNISCPFCNSSNVKNDFEIENLKSLLAYIKSSFLTTFNSSKKNKFYCSNCNSNFFI